MTTKPAPVLKRPCAEWICYHIPEHTCWVEPYFGSGAVFSHKEPSNRSTINDLDGEVVNLFRVLRDKSEILAEAMSLTPYARQEWENSCVETCACPKSDVERARRFLTRSWQSVGYTSGGWRTTKLAHTSSVSVWNKLPERIAFAAQRLREAQIECRPALDVLVRVAGEDSLIYADPPYLHETRVNKSAYGAFEMANSDHEALLAALLRHPGPALLSGYNSPLYNDTLPDWKKLTRPARTLSAAAREECLWLNPETMRRLSSR